ncbi:hypothetical protein PZ897_15225 [Hoeflea sp. YIM 152468]|uniref:hypothetical protein n=1 Tax=Hoeflea sp. YIM 152468 TaxID=3031759 RepID=UPI0023DBCB6D|nr:hypothetical protein [Hoeflea sp. YIM 152468]MDF1609537.1 hypothetical protein [Hoeflea sp. YIM 152468]
MIALCPFLTTPVVAEEVIAEYLAWLDVRDTVNSKGVKLKSFGAVLAQDRANFHRFGIRQELDTDDAVFGSRDMREKLPQLYKAGRSVDAYIRRDVMSGRGHYVFVRVMGQGGRVTHVDVHEGAG